MTSLLAGLLRSLFPALVLAFAVIVLAAAALYGLASGNLLTACVAAVAGLMAVLLLFGMLALQIENHRLLARIAQAQAPEGQAELASALMGGRDLLRELAPELGREKARELGRREPVVTLRPHASYEPI